MLNSQMQSRALPELLCPAGSPLALDAALEGGADAVYLGSLGRNARMNAKNFDPDDLAAGIRRAHLLGAKVYMTLNTLVYDREMSEVLRAAAGAQAMGVDALIVADLGAAALIHRTLPELALHASTQAGAHNAAAGAFLADLGFNRMVVARELSFGDLQTAVANSPIEIEAFIHGALCVCHSGSCLFSSMVGGRSGNRGECAQPCRLPYNTPRGQSDYPLSLKDLSLARHVPALIQSGVASLKIEGRMRAPEYVLAVTRIWRRLLDEGRGANEDEMRQLAEAFSRDGFTDGYFTGKVGHRMLGVRSEADKQAGRALPPFTALTRRAPLDMEATVRADAPITLTVTAEGQSYTATGDIPSPAINAPLSEDTIRRQMTKLGNTMFAPKDCRVTVENGLMLPISALNSLRRAALAGLEALLCPVPTQTRLAPEEAPTTTSILPVSTAPVRTATMTTAHQLTDAAADYFDICYLPAEVLLAMDEARRATLSARTTLAVTLPPIIMDQERESVREQLSRLHAIGIRRTAVGNIGHLSLVAEAGMTPDGDLRLNVANRETLTVLTDRGLWAPVLSPELTQPRLRDLAVGGRAVVYGRLPLMLLEKCVIREIADCDTCAKGAALLTDRRGSRFPVLRTPDHRNVIYNSLPTDMSDRQEDLRHNHIRHWHFIFSVESAGDVDAVIQEFQTGVRKIEPVRRIQQ